MGILKSNSQFLKNTCINLKIKQISLKDMF